MKREVNTIEKQFIDVKLFEFFNGATSITFTGSTISPYKLMEVLPDYGFKMQDYERNDSDFWYKYLHNKLGSVTLYFNAILFELTLEVDNND
jgi:hypothetical protein